MNRLTENSTHQVHARKPIMAALLVAGIASFDGAQAALTTGTMLNFSSGVRGCLVGGTFPSNCLFGLTTVTSGSYFGMDTDGDFTAETGERTPITATGPIVYNATSLATGSHSLVINGSENPAFDIWEFFGNTGMDYIRTAPTVVNDAGATKFLGFSGWTVTWNSIATIPMNAGSWSTGTGFFNGGESTARIVCATAGCNNGEAFTLDYYATVPVGDPSGFGGVRYNLFLVGNIVQPGALSTNATAITPGTTAVAVGSADGRINTANLTAQGIPLDPNYHAVSLFYDFNVTTATGSANVVIPLSQKIPTSPVWRIVNPATGVWRTFLEDVNNIVKSATGTSDACPAPGAVAYAAPPTPGHFCLQLTIQDNGANDNNATAGTISDPGGITTGTPAVALADTRTSSTVGCSLSQQPVTLKDKGDWLAVFGFIAWLGMLFRRRQRAE